MEYRETGSGSRDAENRSRGGKKFESNCTKWRHAEFFFSLARLIGNAEEELNSPGFCDTSEFLTRRLDEYERTLSTLLARFRESYGHLQSQQDCIANLTHLLNRTTYQRSHFQRLCFLYWDDNVQGNERRVLSSEHSDAQGRPSRLAISQEQLEVLQRDCTNARSLW